MSSLSPHQDPLPHPPAISPNDPRSPPAPSPGSSAPSSNAQLATILASTCQELEALRLELKAQTQRAEKAERLLQSMTHVSDAAPNSTTETLRIISEYEERARRAEIARDEAEARRRVIADGWTQFERYLSTIDTRMLDARAGFNRIVTEGGGSLVLAPIPSLSPSGINMPPPPPRQQPHPPSSRSANAVPTRNSTQSFQTLALPPPPNPNATSLPSRVRPRAGSLDGSNYTGSLVGQPPTKKYRGDRDDRRGYDDRPTYSDFPQHAQQPLHQTHSYHALEPRDRERDYPDQRTGHVSQLPNSRHLHPNDDYSRYQSRSRSGRSRSRDSVRSNRSSLSVDELLAETIDGPNGTNGNGVLPGNASPHPSLDARNSRQRRRDEPSATRILHSTEHHSYHQQTLQHSQRGLPDSPPHPPYPQRGTQLPGSHADDTSNSSSAAGIASQPGGQVQVYQTHVFAPVVTGAPVKKTKYAAAQGSVGNLNGVNGSVGPIGSVDAPPPAPPPPSFPASNAQGQRICRQCGLPGRYKDGKCVEKWGPGPMGPGTVCDRCRKKMKRVERRGTLVESQHNQGSTIIQQTVRQPVQAQVTLPQAKPADRSLHRGDTTIITQSAITNPSVNSTQSLVNSQRDREESRPNSRAANVVSTSSNTVAIAGIHPSSGKSVRPPPSPPPNPSLPDDNVNSGGTNRGRRAGSTSRAQSRSSSKTPRGSLKRPNSPSSNSLNVGAGDGVVSKRSPLASGVVVGPTNGNGLSQKNGNVQRMSPGNGYLHHLRMDVDGDADADGEGDGVEDGDGEVDVDADAEAELDDADAELAGVVDGLMNTKGELDAEADGDADADLLEAVDAAEANSNGSATSGWLKAEV
ncbi:hypothetical protein AX16_006530 [Volvariella volvacea WC 439]|nr:hypothetical protein AX16_006530 [Volvariella volvacea WC 439]